MQFIKNNIIINPTYEYVLDLFIGQSTRLKVCQNPPQRLKLQLSMQMKLNRKKKSQYVDWLKLKKKT